MKMLPMSALIARIGAASTPASPASAMPKPNTGVTQRPTLMPRARERSAFSVEARTIMPTRVLVSSNHTPTQTSDGEDGHEDLVLRQAQTGRSPPALEPGGQLVRQPRDAVATLDEVDEEQRDAEGQQEVVERVEPQQPAHEQPLHQHAEPEHQHRHDRQRRPRSRGRLRRAGPRRRPRRACSRRRGQKLTTPRTPKITARPRAASA